MIIQVRKVFLLHRCICVYMPACVCVCIVEFCRRLLFLAPPLNITSWILWAEVAHETELPWKQWLSSLHLQSTSSREKSCNEQLTAALLLSGAPRYHLQRRICDRILGGKKKRQKQISAFDRSDLKAQSRATVNDQRWDLVNPQLLCNFISLFTLVVQLWFTTISEINAFLRSKQQVTSDRCSVRPLQALQGISTEDNMDAKNLTVNKGVNGIYISYEAPDWPVFHPFINKDKPPCICWFIKLFNVTKPTRFWRKGRWSLQRGWRDSKAFGAEGVSVILRQQTSDCQNRANAWREPFTREGDIRIFRGKTEQAEKTEAGRLHPDSATVMQSHAGTDSGVKQGPCFRISRKLSFPAVCFH